MPDFAPDAFTIFANFNEDKSKDGHYWALIDLPLDELRKLSKWADTAERCKDIKGNECVKLRANLMPRTAKESGNAYLMMALSDAKPRTADKPRIDF